MALNPWYTELLLISKEELPAISEAAISEAAISEAIYFRVKNQTIPNSSLLVIILESNNYTPDTVSNLYPR